MLSQDVLYTICNNCGPVQRIVIFRKNGVQAMVEYPLKQLQPNICLMFSLTVLNYNIITVITEYSGVK